MTSCAIEAADLRVVLGGRAVLTLDRWRLPAGDLAVILGPNGAGKSTLLKVFLGLVRPISGSVRVLGDEAMRLTAGGFGRLRRRIGYVPQSLEGGGPAPLTVREVVAIGRTGRAGLGRRLARTDWQRVDIWIERLGLGPVAARPYGETSGGEQRKTLLAKALVQEPEILLLDEPTANLDLAWREHLVAALDHLHATTRLTTVLVCHELEVIPPSCRQVLLLHRGTRVATGMPDDVLVGERLAGLYGAGLDVVRRGRRFALIPCDTGGRGRL
jgi:ABC-type cobalamin/Fe3+-siderophores transport system ATPase subunit